MNNSKFIFFALSPTGNGLSGGDRIFIELAREWSKVHPVEIYTTQEGVEMCKRQKLFGKYLVLKKVEKQALPPSFFLKYIYKVYFGIRLGILLNIQSDSRQKVSNNNLCLYSSSDFWMDVFPAVILKIRYPKLKWVATWFMTAPNPLKGFSEGRREDRYRSSAFLYWLSQLPVKSLIKKYADFVIVNNEDERKRFSVMDKKGKVIVLIGAVRLEEIERYSKRKMKGDKHRVYDAVFQGRFHPQKGVVELIDIWQKVVGKIPNAKLAMIGDGPLMKKVKLQISNYKLEKNVKLFGYLFDGEKKYRIFSQSKIVVHPAFYDSGGMASAEAMAFGIPAVGFDLKAYESYYPKGMIKVKKGDLTGFANMVIELLKNIPLRDKVGREALRMVGDDWDWKRRSEILLSKIA
jgi:glycosyltransferase involved in cell wall biosynthesis